MDVAGLVDGEPRGIYEIEGHRVHAESNDFAPALARAHAAHRRPRCLCQSTGVEMYVARHGAGFIVKRMPDTGGLHAPACPSYEPPANWSGVGEVLGSAITQNPATGLVTLKLDFALQKQAGRPAMAPTTSQRDSVATDGSKLSLRGLLHYLWDQAGLTRWQPGFEGKRSWATVRRQLHEAAQNMLVRGINLQSQIYIPESFSLDQRDAILARRTAQWAAFTQAPGATQRLMLMIAEVKEIVPARYGFKAVIKHVPDQAFAMDEQLYRRLGGRFDAELSLWSAANKVQMLIIATLKIGSTGIPSIAELTLMPVNMQWLPIEDTFDRHLVDVLVRDQRSFIRCLRYNMAPGRPVSTALLIDTPSPPSALFIARQAGSDQSGANVFDSENLSTATWVWQINNGVMPALPKPASKPIGASHNSNPRAMHHEDR